MFNLAVAHSNAPVVTVYPFNNGVKYSDPHPPPLGNGKAIAFDSIGNIAIGHDSYPHFSVYKWDGGFSTPIDSTGFFIAPPVNDIDFLRYTPSGNIVAMAFSSLPFYFIFRWNTQTGAITKFANNAVALPGIANSLKLSRFYSFLAIAHAVTPFITVFPLSYSDIALPLISAKVTNPGTLPTGTGNGVDWNPDDTDLAVAHTSSPYITVYKDFSTAGTKYANPATLPTGDGMGVHFSPDGTALAVAHTTTPFISVYPWNSGVGFGTKYANPATLPTGNAKRVAFSPDSKMIAIAHDSSPYVSVYPWSAGFGAKYADPETLPTGNGKDVAWSPINYELPIANTSFTI